MALTIVIRPWDRRRDRSAIERWPAAQLPAHWMQPADSEDAGQRESWAIVLAGQLVGRITLRAFNPISDMARLGIYLHPEFYGQGIGTEALRRFIAIAPVSTIRLDVSADNQRAVRCYRKLGFQALYYDWRQPDAVRIEMEFRRASGRAVADRFVSRPVH